MGGDTEQRLNSALNEWTALLGEAGVMRSAQADYGACTMGSKRKLLGALCPSSRAQVPEIARIAQRWRVPLYPLSTGRNWGYGSDNPVRDGCVLLDLSRLDRIVDFDPELGVVTVEPGVTQAALRNFLDEQGATYLVPVTGAGPTCSILGNALERGYGITPVTDHFGAVTAIEAVLPDGRLYRAPLSELGGHEVNRLFKWGVGPYLDGLFAQGSFGIVTTATIALAHQPEAIAAFFFGADDERALEALVPTVRQVLRSMGGLVPAINLLNRHRMLSMMAPFPVADAPDGVLPAELVDKLARDYKIQAWNGVGAVYGSKATVRAACRDLRRLLKPAASRLIFVTRPRLKKAQSLARLLPRGPGSRLKDLTNTLSATLDIMNGRPSEVALPLAYWRSGRRPAPGQAMNPGRDGCGLIWYAPLVPMRAEAARRYISVIERICPQFGINPLITLTTANERCFDSTVPLLFDRDDARATQRAQACYEALFEAGRSEGFLPYRLNVDSMGLIDRDGSVASEVTTQLKQAIDPQNLIAPGRYASHR